MRLVILNILALALFGCASQPSNVATAQQPQPQQMLVEHPYAPAAAGALAFDPPVLAGTPKLDLSRDGRGPAAFVGYQDISTTVYDLQIDDRQLDLGSDHNGNRGSSDYYQRRAVSEQIGASYR